MQKSEELLATLDFAREVIDEAALTDIDHLGMDERAFAIFCDSVFRKLLLDRGVDEQLAHKLTPKFVAAIAARRRELALVPTSKRIH